MQQTADPFAQGEDVNTWLRGTTDSLTPKTFELLLFVIIILILRRFLTQDSSQNNDHEELVKITSSLSYAFTTQLKLNDKHVTYLQEDLTRAQRRIDKLEVKVQDQLKAPNEREQETTEQVKELQGSPDSSSARSTTCKSCPGRPGKQTPVCRTATRESQE